MKLSLNSFWCWIGLLLGLVLWVRTYEAILRPEYTEVEKQYLAGRTDEAANALSGLTAGNEEERAFLAYMSAMLKVKRNEIRSGLELVISKYPNSEYAQRSRLELAKMQVLEREITAAGENLKKITSNYLLERHYWLALCYWWEDDYAKAIGSVENYLRLAPKGVYCEDAYYLLAECYLAQQKAYSAITTLSKLQSLQLPDLDQQYLLYRTGYCYEISDKLTEAVGYYRQGYELDKYSQIAYTIEDRLFDLKYKSKTIDISFLYPYSVLQIAPPPEEVSSTSPLLPNGSIEPKSPAAPPPNMDDPIKLKGKPQNGFYIQAGRFSQEANANKLVLTIRLLSLPAAYYEDISANKKTWVVISGAYENKDKAEEARSLLMSKDINCFVAQY